MNISFFLKPKVEVSYLTESCPVQKAIDDMLHSGFTAIPVVDAKENTPERSPKVIFCGWCCITRRKPSNS